MEGCGKKEIFTKGVGNNQKEGEGRGWDNRNFLLSFHSTSTNQTSIAELITIPCLGKKPLLQASVWDVLFKKQIFQSKEVSKEKRVSCSMLVNWRPNSQSWNPKKYKTVSADKTYWNLGGKRLYIMTRDNEWKSYICTVKQWYVVTCFTRVIYIYANSPGLSGSLPLSRTGDQNSRIRGSLDQLPTKNYNLVSVCSKISKSSGFLCLYYGFWLHFLAWYTLFVANKKRSKISCLKSLIDRSTFFPRSWSVGGGYWSGKKSQDLRSPEIGISEYGYYQLNWKRKLAMVKNFKANVSSVSP